MSDLGAALRRLHRDRSNTKWDERTAGGAPRKPLVMLALCDLAETGHLATPLAPFDGPAFEALARALQNYWRALFPDTNDQLWMPLGTFAATASGHPSPVGRPKPAVLVRRGRARAA